MAGRGELTSTELPGSRAAGRTIGQTVIHPNATLVTARSDKQDAKGNFKGGFGYHPLGAWPDNTNEALAAVLRPGNAGRNTAADHLTVVDTALVQPPDRWRGKPTLIRADGAGYSHALIAAHFDQGLEFSVGYPVTETVCQGIAKVLAWAGRIACNADGGLREHADVVEFTGLLDLSPLGKDRPGHARHRAPRTPTPDARWTPSRSATATATKPSSLNAGRGQLALLEARHRVYAWVEDRIRTGKDTGLGRLPPGTRTLS